MRGWGDEEGFVEAKTASFSKKESTESVSDPEEVTPETKHANPTAIKTSFIVVMFVIIFKFPQLQLLSLCFALSLL